MTTRLRAGAPIPVGVVTGFLGAGKTTFINRLLRDPGLADTLVLVNEFGEIGLDHLLIERIEGEAILLSSGCVCCALRGDLIDALRDSLSRRDAGREAFSRIVLETSGGADPAPALQAIGADPALAGRLTLAGVVALIDAVNGAATLERHVESRRQAALADWLIFSKGDLLAKEEREARLFALARAVRSLNGYAPFADALEEFSAENLFSIGGMAKGADRGAWPRYGRFAADEAVHDQAFVTRSFSSAAPIAPAAFADFLDLFRASRDERLLRVKGLIALADNPVEPLLVQGVRHLLHPPRRLPHWPDADQASRIVFIGEAGALATIDRLWAALTGAPAIDAPDRAALRDNPLALQRGGLFDAEM